MTNLPSPTERSTIQRHSEPRRKRMQQRLAVFVAVAMLALTVGSMAIVLNIAHNNQSRTGTTSSIGSKTTTVAKPTLGKIVYSKDSRNDIYTVAWAPDSQRVAFTTLQDVQTQDTTTGNHVLHYLSTSPEIPFYGVAWSHNGKRIAGSSDKVYVWDASSTRLLYTLPSSLQLATITAHSTQSVAATENNRMYYSSRVSTLAPKSASIPSSGGSPVWTVAWSPDDKRIASAFDGGGGNIVQVWDSATGKLLLTYRGHSDYINALAWSPNGKYIASVSYDHTVQVWETATGRKITTFPGSSAAVSWSPDGKRIVSAGNFVQVWDPMSGKVLLTYSQSAVSSLSWSPDGTRIASASNSIAIWNATTGRTLYTFTRCPRTVRTMAWSPNGKYIMDAGGMEEQMNIKFQIWTPA